MSLRIANILTRSVAILIIVSILVLAACTPMPSEPPKESLDISTTEDTAVDTLEIPTDEAQTIPADTPPENLPTSADLDPDADYENIIISSVYSTGRVAGKALNPFCFVELYNNTDKDISLAGCALYLSDHLGNVTSYPFTYAQTISAGSYFLIKGESASGKYETVFEITDVDAVMPLRPDEYGFSLVIAPVGMTIDGNSPLRHVEGVFNYVTSLEKDREDVNHYVGDADPDRLIRKKANTNHVDYQRIDLTEASTTVLQQIRPKNSRGDTNTQVTPLRDEVLFSVSGGIYKDPQTLTLSAPEGYDVYYTLDGTDPRENRGFLYDEPLRLSDSSSWTWGDMTKLCGDIMGPTYYPNTADFPGAWVVKAYAVRKHDGNTTPLITQTYFIGDSFSEMPLDMVNVSLNPDDFLGEEGIYNTVSGGNTEERDKIAAYIEFFTSKDLAKATDGRVYAGWSEIAMNGKGSLGMTQKSFRVLFKNTIEGEGDMGENLTTFTYDLFGDYASRTADGERVTWYRHLLLRNGGGDMSGSTISRSHFGDAYIQRVDRFLGADIMASSSVMVFINGEFWGIYNTRDRMDTKYFEGKYGIPEESFTMLECPHPLVFGWNVDYTTTYGEESEAKVFMDLINFCRSNDLSVPENYQYVADRVDIDGLIDFFCAQIYLCCSDWPSNNIKVWRNTNPDLMDTKWHFCIVDTDHGVGLNSSVDTNLFGVINDVSVMGSLFNRLCGNKDFKDQFICRFIWCLEFYFEPEWMLQELDTMLTPIRPLMQYQLDRWRALDNTMTSYELWDHYIEVIKDFVQRRPAYAKQQLINWAGITEAKYYVYKADAIKRWGIKNIHEQ